MVTEGQVKAIDGSLVPVKAESICLHGDNQHSLQFAARIVEELEKKSYNNNGISLISITHNINLTREVLYGINHSPPKCGAGGGIFNGDFSNRSGAF